MVGDVWTKIQFCPSICCCTVSQILLDCSAGNTRLKRHKLTPLTWKNEKNLTYKKEWKITGASTCVFFCKTAINVLWTDVFSVCFSTDYLNWSWSFSLAYYSCAESETASGKNKSHGPVFTIPSYATSSVTLYVPLGSIYSNSRCFSLCSHILVFHSTDSPQQPGWFNSLRISPIIWYNQINELFKPKP